MTNVPEEKLRTIGPMCLLMDRYTHSANSANYTPTTFGVQFEEKLHMGVHEQERLNTTALSVRENGMSFIGNYCVETRFLRRSERSGHPGASIKQK
jgi:hypothetical protein